MIDAQFLDRWCDNRDGRRFVVHAAEKLTAFLELESAIRSCGELDLTRWRDFCQARRR
jgi:hypothetical protein